MSQTLIRWKKMTPIPQESGDLCWLAAYQMMFQWKGKPLDTLRPLLEGTLGVLRTATAFDEGIDRPEWPLAAKAFGMTGRIGADVKLDEVSELLSNGPLLVHGLFPLGMHSIVVFGTDDDLDQIGYINPYWVGVKQVGTRWSAFKWLHDGIVGNKGHAAVIQHW